jgi:large subunit ribosomal protein L3
MSKGFAKKIGMTRLFVGTKAVAVTVLEVEESFVLQQKEYKTKKTIQLGSNLVKKVTNPMIGHIQKYIPDATAGFRHIAEFEITDLGDKTQFDVNDFAEGDKLDITGVTIGKGFAGAMKRWGFKGQPQTHGHDHVRAVGSIGSRWPQRVPKGKKMAGRLGGQNLTIKKAQILAIDKESKLLFVKGSLPGANSSYVKLNKVA